jgi:hypothetical protein
MTPRTAEHWRAWLKLLESCPGRERELSARVRLLLPRFTDHPDPLLAAIHRATEVEGGLELLEQTEVIVVRRPRGWRLALAAAVLLGVGSLALPTQAPPTQEPERAWRGEALDARGVVRIEQDRQPLLRLIEGEPAPELTVAPGLLLVRWQPQPGDNRGATVTLGGSSARVEGYALLPATTGTLVLTLDDGTTTRIGVHVRAESGKMLPP